MILGISLVVNELNKGQRMVFRYPESIPAVVENGPNKGLVKLYNQYFSFSLENLAKLFRPKNALYSKVLEISIDDLCFVSYPCQCQGLTYNDTGVDNDSSSNCFTGLSSSPIISPTMSPVNSINTNNIPGEVITMFNIIITSVSSKAMRQIIPDFEFKCQYKFASMPGSDPVAAALGLRCQTYGICKQTMRRLVEEIAAALLQQEKNSRYVTEQVTLMLRIMDNWSSSKQSDGSGGGPMVAPVMESGSQTAQAVMSRVSDSDSTPGVSRANSTRPGYSDSSSIGTSGIPGTTPGTTTGSYGNTPRTSRSNSNAHPVVFDTSSGVISPPVNINTTTTAVASKANPDSISSTANTPAVNSASAASTAGTGRGIASDGMVGVIGVTPKSSRASAVLYELSRMGEEGVRGPGSPAALSAAAGTEKGLSIETEFSSDLLERNSAVSQTATPSVLAAVAIATTSLPTQAHASSASHSYLAQALLSGSGGEVTGLPPTTDSGKSSPALPHQTQETATTTAVHGGSTATSALHTTISSTASLNPSRTGSTMPPVPSRSGSGLSTTPSKPPASMNTGSSVCDTSSSIVGTAAGGNQHTRSTEWGAHLLIDFIAQSSLANELRLLYHAMSGGHSVNISFNSIKATNIPMFCKDASLCEDSQLLRAMQYCTASELIPGGGPLVPPSTATAAVGNKYTTINLSAIRGSSHTSSMVRTRQTAGSPHGRSSNLNAALHGTITSHSSTSHKSGKNTRGYAKMKGINLNSQTMLRIADSDTIINILHTLDSNVFCLAASAESEASGLNSHTNSTTDLVGMKTQIRLLTSTRLYAFLDAADPTQSFLDLSMTLDEPVEELVSMANYLRSWGLAEVIPVIYSRSCYKVQSQAALHRDCRVGRAYEALLLSFNIPLQQQPMSRVETELTMSRPNSEPFLMLGALSEIAQQGAGSTTPTPIGDNYTNGPAKRRSSSIVSTDGSCESTKPMLYTNPSSQSSAATFHSVPAPVISPVPSISNTHTTTAGGQGHYLVSPVISKFRRRNEGVREDSSPAMNRGTNSLRNSRSGDLLKSFANVQNNMSVLEKRTETGLQQQKHTEQGSIPLTSHLVKRTISSNGATASTNTGSDGVASGGMGGRMRERGNSFGNERNYQNTPTGGIKAYISALFGPLTSNNSSNSSSNDLPVRGLPSRPAPIVADATCFREVDVPSPAPVPLTRAIPSEAASSMSGRLGESAVHTNTITALPNANNPLSSSFPPASLSSMNMSNANRDQGMQHIVSLAEVGSVISSKARAQSNIDETVFSVLGEKTQQLAPQSQPQQQPTADINTPLSPDHSSQSVHNLDSADNIPLQYSLPVVLAAFNGARVLQEVVELLPAPLRDFSVDIVVFLLRWHVIVPVDSYIVNMLAILEPHSASGDVSSATATGTKHQPAGNIATTSSSTNGGQHCNSNTTTSTSSAGSRTPHYALSGRSIGSETSAFSTSPGNHFTQNFYRNNVTGSTNTDVKPNPSQWEEAINLMRTQLPKGLNASEKILTEKLYPYIAQLTISSKTVSEMAWVLRVSEEDLLATIDKIPYLHIVKKLAA